MRLVATFVTIFAASSPVVGSGISTHLITGHRGETYEVTRACGSRPEGGIDLTTWIRCFNGRRASGSAESSASGVPGTPTSHSHSIGVKVPIHVDHHQATGNACVGGMCRRAQKPALQALGGCANGMCGLRKPSNQATIPVAMHAPVAAAPPMPPVYQYSQGHAHGASANVDSYGFELKFRRDRAKDNHSRCHGNRCNQAQQQGYQTYMIPSQPQIPVQPAQKILPPISQFVYEQQVGGVNGGYQMQMGNGGQYYAYYPAYGYMTPPFHGAGNCHGCTGTAGNCHGCPGQAQPKKGGLISKLGGCLRGMICK